MSRRAEGPSPSRRWAAHVLAVLGPAALAVTTAHAGPADVVEASARCEGSVCTFEVTVRHADTGWDHYADAWEVLAPDGEVLGRRVLHHPHVEEQPFTRQLRGVEVPEGVREVRIRARDSVHGFGGREAEVPLPDRTPP